MITVLCDIKFCPYNEQGYCCKPYLRIINGLIQCEPYGGKEMNKPIKTPLNIIEDVSIPINLWQEPKSIEKETDILSGTTLMGEMYEP